MKDIRRKCNLTVNLSKFTSNKKILNKVVALCTTNFVAKFCLYILSSRWLNVLRIKETKLELEVHGATSADGYL